jgi:hypothetical protein
LLWDGWQAMSDPDGPSEEEIALTDEIAGLIVAADAGDRAAEQQVLDRFGPGGPVGPGSRITMMSPYGDPPVQVDLSAGPGTVHG